VARKGLFSAMFRPELLVPGCTCKDHGSQDISAYIAFFPRCALILYTFMHAPIGTQISRTYKTIHCTAAYFLQIQGSGSLWKDLSLTTSYSISTRTLRVESRCLTGTWSRCCLARSRTVVKRYLWSNVGDLHISQLPHFLRGFT
jgi:hypothetical protein